MSNNLFKAGAGKAEIIFPDKAFPTAREEYVGVHDNPHARVVLLETTEKFVIYNLELVNVFPDTREKIVNALIENTGVSEQNIWFHVNHVLSTPHAWMVDTSHMGAHMGRQPKFQRTPQQQESVEAVSEAIVSATATAAKQAAESLKDAKVGYTTGWCEANTNRSLETSEGWWTSCNDEGVIDHNVPILRIDSLSGETIAILFGFHSQPAVLDMVFLQEGGRLVSGDIAGYSTNFIEEQYEGSVAMYFTGAGGDGTPYLRGSYFLRGRDGKRIDNDIHEKAYIVAQLIGERLGQQVVMAADRVTEMDESAIVKMNCVDIQLPALKKEEGPGRPEHPMHEKAFIEDGERELPVMMMQIGKMGFFGLVPEINQVTAKDIEEKSPYNYTMISTFTSGAKERGGGKYMPDVTGYEKVTFQALNSMFAKGAAEKMADYAIAALNKLKEE